MALLATLFSAAVDDVLCGSDYTCSTATDTVLADAVCTSPCTDDEGCGAVTCTDEDCCEPGEHILAALSVERWSGVPLLLSWGWG